MNRPDATVAIDIVSAEQKIVFAKCQLAVRMTRRMPHLQTDVADLYGVPHALARDRFDALVELLQLNS